MNLSALTDYKSSFVLPQYKTYYSSKLARICKPIVYSNQCFSGAPSALYYRIIANDFSNELCIQYFYYWDEQECIPSHIYDYEPIFSYINRTDLTYTLIVNGGLGSPPCGLHKNEIRPKSGNRSVVEQHFVAKMSAYPYYPFGGTGQVTTEGCYKQYPLDGNDLTFKHKHPIFGIRACSNVFSGASIHLQGFIFDPPIRKLTDRILNEWYLKHYENENEMPFGHDVSDPFTFPYVKYRSAREPLRIMRNH